jgi:hypothetical protein
MADKADKRASNYPLNPSVALLAKLGSILVHVEEYLSPDGSPFDRAAIDAGLNDAELRAWLAGMDRLTLVPKKRSKP